MGERLSGGNVAIALLANTIASGAALVALILTFGSISGAHFNPAGTLADASQRGLPWPEVPAYLIAQITGAFVGVAVAHLMFREPLFSASQHARSGAAQLFSEFGASFGLLSVIWGCVRTRSSFVPFAVGACLLVYCFALVCEPRRNPGCFREQHTCGNSANGRTRLCRRSSPWCICCRRIVSVAGTDAFFRGVGCSCST